MKCYFLSKFKNTMLRKDGPGCPGGDMVQRSGIATCLIVRGMSTSVVWPVVLNFSHRFLSKTARILYLVECKTEERDIHLALLSFFVNFSTYLLLRLKSRSVRVASHHPAFMGNCRTITHTFYSLIYPVDEGNENVGSV